MNKDNVSISTILKELTGNPEETDKFVFGAINIMENMLDQAIQNSLETERQSPEGFKKLQLRLLIASCILTIAMSKKLGIGIASLGKYVSAIWHAVPDNIIIDDIDKLD